ncbi:Hyalin [Holothuria leucospilota]|uniref:Hyalin n=1 Tax=Holothuria leucospilota TaxID=206669 RepID=A0A9Q1BWX2_HOLLE|nr:Hyalin [Holothuria leucospilota]
MEELTNTSTATPLVDVQMAMVGQHVLSRVTWMEPTSVLAGTNANEVLTRTSYLGSSDYFPVGVTRVSYRNQIAKCTFNVIVQGHILDTTPPKIYNCPERQLSMTVENEQENVTSLWSEIFAEDESCQPVQITSSHKPRDYFFVGVTLVTYNFTDSSGNLAQCIFSVNISVLETEQNRGSPPGFAFCPESIVVNSSSGTTRTQVTWVEPTLRSSVTEFTLYQSHFPGDSFPVGRTNVIYEIQVLNDDSSTQAHCRFDVYVKGK